MKKTRSGKAYSENDENRIVRLSDIGASGDEYNVLQNGNKTLVVDANTPAKKKKKKTKRKNIDSSDEDSELVFLPKKKKRKLDSEKKNSQNTLNKETPKSHNGDFDDIDLKEFFEFIIGVTEESDKKNMFKADNLMVSEDAKRDIHYFKCGFDKKIPDEWVRLYNQFIKKKINEPKMESLNKLKSDLDNEHKDLIKDNETIQSEIEKCVKDYGVDKNITKFSNLVESIGKSPKRPRKTKSKINI
jgi:hypothetical protein